MDTKRLERLLYSIPFTRNDIEVIVIDDCSPDQRLLIELQGRWIHKQLRWLSTNENSGAGVGRNLGLEAAQAEWLVFADSDDEFLPDAFQLFDKNLRSDDELVYFLSEAVQEKDGKPSMRSDEYNRLVYAYSTFPNKEMWLELAIKHVVPWGKIYSRKFIKSIGLHFDEVRRSNDVAFNVLGAVQATRMRAITSFVYRIYRRSSSLTTEINSEAFINRFKVSISVAVRLDALGFKKIWPANGMLLQSIKYGPNVFFHVCLLTFNSPMLVDWKRIFNIAVWRKFYTGKKAEKKEVNNMH